MSQYVFITSHVEIHHQTTKSGCVFPVGKSHATDEEFYSQLKLNSVTLSFSLTLQRFVCFILSSYSKASTSLPVNFKFLNFCKVPQLTDLSGLCSQ